MPPRKSGEGKSAGGVSKSSSRKNAIDGLGGWDDDDEQQMGSSFTHISRAISEELKDPSAARSRSDTDDADGDEGPAPPDFWAEVQEEARAMMAEQLDAEMAAAREEGLRASKQDLEHARREAADFEAEAEDLRLELETVQRKLAEAQTKQDDSKRAEVSDRTAEKRDIQTLQEEREKAKKLAQTVGVQARELHDDLKDTRSELEEYKKRALHAEGIVEECRREARAEAHARKAMESEVDQAKADRKGALRSVKQAEDRCNEAEVAAQTAERKAQVAQTNGEYVKKENARLKGETKELRAAVLQLEMQLQQQDCNGEGMQKGLSSVIGVPGPGANQYQPPQASALLAQALAQSEAREAALNRKIACMEVDAQRSGASLGPATASGSRGASRPLAPLPQPAAVAARIPHGTSPKVFPGKGHCLNAYQEQSIALWNDMHGVVDALEEAEKAASRGHQRPPGVARALASAKQWATPPRVPGPSAASGNMTKSAENRIMAHSDPGTPNALDRQVTLPPLPPPSPVASPTPVRSPQVEQHRRHNSGPGAIYAAYGPSKSEKRLQASASTGKKANGRPQHPRSATQSSSRRQLGGLTIPKQLGAVGSDEKFGLSKLLGR